MLAIRLQRTGRKGLAQYRVVVQEARLTPTSGRIVALLGSYDPHTKKITLSKDKATFYLSHGAQPSPRVVSLLTSEGVDLPKWVNQPAQKNKTLKHAEKLRKNRPAVAEAPAPSPATEAEEPAPAAETPEPQAAATETDKTAEAPAEAEPAATEPQTESPAESTEPESDKA
ncbi:MAG: rpsP [Candidatus Saccharibacteria bacterium]|nr:rpsP [Candidatus Saccharibacteria bacterium]